MKDLLAILLAGMMTVGGLANAQSATSTTPAIEAVFYDGNPYSGGEVLKENANGPSVFGDPLTITLPNSAGNIEGLEEAEYVMLNVGERSLAFEIQEAGTSLSSIDLVLNDGEGNDAVSLANVIGGVQRALSGEAELAVFTDGAPENGVVVGFYTFGEGDNFSADPSVSVDGATYLTLTNEGEVTTFEAKANNATRLSNVQVRADDGEFVSLLRMSLG